MTKPINLDIRKMLPVIRAAFDAKKLQMFDPEGSTGSYTGLCSIGICLTPMQRWRLDNEHNGYTKLCSLFYAKKVKAASKEIETDLDTLQGFHDSAVGTIDRAADIARNRFNEYLTSLEEKYNVVA